MSDDHLDDDVLSAVLDGEATATESAHADTCATCGARLGALRDASLLLRTPVPPADDAQREAAIAAALAAAPSNVVPMRGRTRSLPSWLGKAAVVLLLVGAFGLLARAGTSGDDDEGTAASSADSADSGDDTTDLTLESGASELESADSEANMTLRAAPYDGGDLGAIDDLDLQATVERAIGVQEEAAADQDAAGEAATTSAPAESAAGGSSAAAPMCEDAIRAGDPSHGALVYRASGTEAGEPAEILAFDVLLPDGAVERRVFVVQIDGCEVTQSEQYAV